MTYVKKMILLVAAGFSLATAQAQVSNPDTMIHKLFATLKANDEEGFIALYPNPVQMQALMRNILETSLHTQEVKQAMAENSVTNVMNVDSLIQAQIASISRPEVAAEMQKSFSKSFQGILEKGQQKGVDWSSSKLISYTYDTTSMDMGTEAAMLLKLGYKNMKGVVDFTAGDSAYQMSFDKLIYIPAEGSWFGGEFTQVVRKGESFAANDVMESKEVTLTGTREMVPPAPPPPAKTKVKVKSKTKTPARKPATTP